MAMQNKEVSLLLVIMLALAPSVRLIIPSLNVVVLYVFIPGLFLVFMLRDLFRLHCKALQYYSILFMWLVLATIASTNIGSSVSEMKTFLGGFLGSIVMFKSSSGSMRNSVLLFIGYLLLLLSTIWFLNNTGALASLDVSSERLNTELVNANDLAYYTFYSVIAVTILLYQGSYSMWINLTCYTAIILLTVFLSIATASRQFLVIVLPFVIYSVYFQCFQKIQIKKIIFPALLIILFLLLYLPDLIINFDGSNLQHRFERDLMEDERILLLKDALLVGMKYPIFGVGPGNLVFYSFNGGFSHCSYTELFATSGLISTIVFVLIIINFIRTQRLRYKNTGNKIFNYLYWSGWMWAIYNFLYVFYSNIWLIAFLFLLYGYSNTVYYGLYNVKRK